MFMNSIRVFDGHEGPWSLERSAYETQSRVGHLAFETKIIGGFNRKLFLPPCITMMLFPFVVYTYHKRYLCLLNLFCWCVDPRFFFFYLCMYCFVFVLLFA